MRKKIKVITVLVLVFMLSLGTIEPAYAASSKKPAAPKITSATVSGVTVTISWGKAKNAKKYQVAKRSEQKSWVKYKTVKKTNKNRKKFTKANKYRVTAKGKKYIVYKYDYTYEIEDTLSKRTYTFYYLTGNTDYTFAVRSVNGKKYSAWRTVTRKTGVYSVKATINGQSIVLTQGQQATLPMPAFPGISVNKSSFEIIPNNVEDDLYAGEDGDVIIYGKTPDGYEADYYYYPNSIFVWSQGKYPGDGDYKKYGNLIHGTKYMGWPVEFNINIYNEEMKAVWTLDGTEPQLNQTDKYINASEYPFGIWTKDDTVRIHGTTTESCSIPEVRWANEKGYGISRSAPIVVWAKLYYRDTLVDEKILIEME